MNKFQENIATRSLDNPNREQRPLRIASGLRTKCPGDDPTQGRRLGEARSTMRHRPDWLFTTCCVDAVNAGESLSVVRGRPLNHRQNPASTQLASAECNASAFECG